MSEYQGEASSQGRDSDRDEDYPRPLYSWYVVGVLLLAYVFSFMDRMILNLLIEPIKRDLHFTDVEISLLLGIAFAAVNATLGLPAGWLVDRTKRVNITAIGVFFWSLMTAACGVARSFWSLFGFRVGVGIGEATLQPAAYSMINDLYPPKRRGLALGVFNLGTAIGSGLALMIGAQVISQVAKRGDMIHVPLLGDIFPWQMVFVVVGLPGFLVALWCWTLREPKRLGALRMKRDAEGTLRVTHVSIADFLRYIQAIWFPFLFAVACYGFIAMGGYGSGAWLASFFQRTHGLTAGQAGTGMGLMSVTFGTFGIVFSGYLSDWLVKRGYQRARMILLALSGILSAPFMLLAVIVPNHYVAFAMLGPGYIATAITSAVWAGVITEMMPNQMRGLAVALAILFANLVGMGLGAPIVAVVTEYIFNGEHDRLALGHSLAIVTPTIYVLSSICGFFAIRKYQSALDYLQQWQTENSGDS